MANRLLLQWYDSKLGGNQMHAIPIISDIQIDLNTQFKAASSMLGGMGSKVSSLMQIMNGAGGTTYDLQSMFDFQMWEKTDPLRLQFEFMFYTKTNPLDDVLNPALSLMNLTILSKIKNKDGAYNIPGISLANLSSYTKTYRSLKKREKNFNKQSKSKLIAFRIPNLLKVEKGILKSAKPTISKELTRSGAPLWIKLDVQLESVYPANDEMFLSEFERLKNNSKLKSNAIQLSTLF